MTRHDLYQLTPASGLGERWRDATPLGNGLTGVALHGGCRQELLVFGRHDLWYGGRDCPIPDTGEELAVTRRLIAEGKHEEACGHLCRVLSREGFAPRPADMRTLAQVTVNMDCPGIYNRYRRILHMDSGEAEITYNLGNIPYRRRTFVSRKRDVTVGHMAAGQAGDMDIIPGFYESGEAMAATMRERDAAEACWRLLPDGLCYSTKHEDGRYFGLAVRVLSDGGVESRLTGVTKQDPQTPYIRVTAATDTTLLVVAFSGAKNRAAGERQAITRLNKAAGEAYDTLLAEHVRLHRRLYATADIKLYHGRTFHSNEDLLAAAREGDCPTELAEKLWRFGRYLFVSGTHKEGNPFPLYGLWCCGYQRPWTQHVGNENVEIIHWHAATGGLYRLLTPLVHYYYKQMETARQVARGVFGCDGIYISTYSTPKTAQVSPTVPVIVHFVGTAGWLCRHFYEYYQLTGDEVLLEREILPLMLETAAFYEDYVTEEEGKLVICPGVSPENSPLEFTQTDTPTATGHYMPVTKDPTVEHAILKELLTHLLELNDAHPLPADRVARWRDMLAKIPPYRVNSDGAIAEWMADWTDNYFHRHLSHVYPLFPGTEIQDSGRVDLIPAFRKAVELRQLGSMTGWSMAHMAAIYARLEDADKAMETVTMLTKVCLLPNFFTLHNDYRGMGITAEDMGDAGFAPVQLDAAMGTVNAVQEMLCFVSPCRVHLLPALPADWAVGHANLHIFGGKIAFSWNANEKRCRAVITATRDLTVTVRLPFGGGDVPVVLAAGEQQTLEI